MGKAHRRYLIPPNSNSCKYHENGNNCKAWDLPKPECGTANQA